VRGGEAQDGAPGVALSAVHAPAVARMASAPQALPDAVAGRNSSGTVSVTLAEAGKVMRRERCTAVERGVVALHSSVTLGAGAAVAAATVVDEAQAPAVAAFTPAPQHLQALQLPVKCAKRALAEQQQPPRHRLVPQS
jgi:hypothetical protein